MQRRRLKQVHENAWKHSPIAKFFLLNNTVKKVFSTALEGGHSLFCHVVIVAPAGAVLLVPERSAISPLPLSQALDTHHAAHAVPCGTQTQPWVSLAVVGAHHKEAVN